MNIRVVTEMMGGTVARGFTNWDDARAYYEEEKKKVDGNSNIFWTEMVVVSDLYTGEGSR